MTPRPGMIREAIGVAAAWAVTLAVFGTFIGLLAALGAP